MKMLEKLGRAQRIARVVHARMSFAHPRDHEFNLPAIEISVFTGTVSL
jgi:hypothetical protein